MNTRPPATVSARPDDREQVFIDICDELGCPYDNEAALKAIAGLKGAATPSDEVREAADAMVGEIEKRFPNWKSYRDLVDCIDCTLHALSTKAKP